MCYPTSRKKYYLHTAIRADWVDAELITDLYQHITSLSLQPLRDLFIPHSQRIGFFSVRSQETADKLVKSFANNYISSGRKSNAEISQISPNNFQIKVSNINNIMTSKEFEEWILSLNYSSFDIQLLRSQILKPSDECILSFDTINAAIYVKQKLQDIKFRGFPLYFTHWHVPRRAPSDSNSQCSGYSTANSTPVSGNGPLYLRDSSIPQPPQRTPPPPPIYSTANTSAASTPDTKHLTISLHSAPINNSRERKSPDYKYIDTHNMLQMSKQQQVIEEITMKNNAIQSELEEEKNFGKYMNDKYSELYKNYVALSRLNRILLWDSQNIIGWIMSLDNGWFIKYKPQLEYHLNMQRMNGAMLSKANKMELQQLGIIDAKDQCLLLHHINNLFGQNHAY